MYMYVYIYLYIYICIYVCYKSIEQYINTYTYQHRYVTYQHITAETALDSYDKHSNTTYNQLIAQTIGLNKHD